MMDLRRLAPLALLVPAVAAGATLKPHWPKDQSVRYDLGAAAPRVAELDVRWAPYGDAIGVKSAKGPPAGGADEDWARAATFRFGPGQAPRVVSHAPRLADGDYAVEIELQAGGRTATVHRRVTLAGGVTTVDLASVVP
jgi:hypothetical protein